MSRRIAGIGVALAGATLLAAITVVTLGVTLPATNGVAAGSSASAAQGASIVSGFPVEADHCFVEAMIPHHQQALELSRLILTAGDARDRTHALAEFIERDQSAEIETMQQWQDAWAEAAATAPAAASGHSAHGTASPESAVHGCGSHTDHAAMKGMATPEQLAMLAELAVADGPRADRMFLRLMIVHHEGALEMATRAVMEGSNAFVRSTAKHVLVEQAREIAAMDALLELAP
jgi:uncharacterized protein (DUF305 family)